MIFVHNLRRGVDNATTRKTILNHKDIEHAVVAHLLV